MGKKRSLTKGQKAIRGASIAELVLKIVQGIGGLVIGLLIMVLGTVIYALIVGIAAGVGGAVGGSEGAEQITENAEMPPIFRNMALVFVIIGLAMLTVGLVFAIVSLKKNVKAKSKSELKVLGILNIIFFNPIVGIMMLAVKKVNYDTIEEHRDIFEAKLDE